jgi:hypothetical protein
MNLMNVSVIAGHFFWGVWEPLPAYQSSGESFRPSCFVMTRHPVQRIMSFYNQRFYREVNSHLYGRDINSFTSSQWEELLIYQRFARLKDDNVTVIIVDEGMSDAACRTMASIKTTTGLENPTSVSVPPELTTVEVNRALSNSKQCVVGVLEQWEDTIRMINHWFPWIDFENKFDLHLNQGSPESRGMREDLLKVTLQNNKCDMMLHEQFLQQFEAQKRILNTPLFR